MNLFEVLAHIDKKTEQIILNEKEIPIQNRNALFELCIHEKYYEYQEEERKKIETFILKTKFPKITKKTILDEDLITIENRLELIKIVADAKEEFQAKYASDVAVSSDIIISGKVVELTKIVADAKEEFQAKYAHDVAVDSNVIKSGKVVELTKIVADAKEEFQAEYASDVAMDSDAIISGKVVEFTTSFIKSISLRSAIFGYELLQKSLALKLENTGLLIEKILTEEYIQQFEIYIFNKKLERELPDTAIDLLIKSLENCTTEEEEIELLEKSKTKKLGEKQN